MRILYQCGECEHIWRGRNLYSHPSRCPNPNCNSRNIFTAGFKVWSNLKKS
ncbi:MAG: hypothetical protein ACFFDH_04460 [Promethearchaeota archaeon]